ncbi:hypothetical protein BV25DRAFT_375123 [Artomyces pyxidatus]|uniref:Uncharacterized protein n=1 Tax=Artomyces pyxidatus TaxID=48021 RepID=A0ACB8T684_9AGAM|nr:hypothetical protein BV25DRAFT_375123 [Artomyces pyxidatus]
MLRGTLASTYSPASYIPSLSEGNTDRTHSPEQRRAFCLSAAEDGGRGIPCGSPANHPREFDRSRYHRPSRFIFGGQNKHTPVFTSFKGPQGRHGASSPPASCSRGFTLQINAPTFSFSVSSNVFCSLSRSILVIPRRVYDMECEHPVPTPVGPAMSPRFQGNLDLENL